ncbi:MAG: hypothetical protein IJW37_02535 [Lachnospiraceae bacterium]|nr:hypothetical protein [Lachnospiraceae bacterium]
MKDKVERLAKGIFEYEQPELLLSEEMLSVSVAAGESFCGKFSVYNREMTVMKGVLYSSSELLVLQETQFIGAENEINYTVHGEYATAGEQHKGEITIVSECGEIRLPFLIRITPLSCESSEGEIRDLFQFASLAQSDWFEAKRLFAQDRFEKTVLADRPAEQTLYRQLTAGPSLDRALEEFLVSGKKKPAVQIRADRTALSFEPGAQAVMERITLMKDTWGYTDVTVETEGDFFLVSAKNVFSENFNGNRYVLEVVVDGATLAEGNYFGRILLKTPKQCIPISVTCSCVRTAREEERKRRAFRVAEAKLFERYFDFRLGKLKAGSYIAEAESIVELLLVRLQEELFAPALQKKKELSYKMYRAYLALIGGKEKFAENEIELLRAEVNRGADAELTGALQYLEAMRQKSAEQVRGYATQIRLLAEQHKESEILLWFRLYTDKRSEGGRAANLAEIAERYEKGSRSPLLYYEAALLWNEDPALLKELGSFELQVLFFALRKGILQKEAVLQFSILAMQTRQREALLCRCLCLAYEQYGQRDTLSALCTLLIATGNRKKKYHRYFAEGCAAQLRIQGLQEYYIYTCECGPQTKLDQSVLLYFIYGNELEEPYCAYLYAYVVRNKDSLGSFYRTYLKRIEQYAVNSIKSGRIDKNLAIIYGEVLRGSLLDAEMAAKLPTLLFSYHVECDNREMVAVSVLHKEEERECIVPLVRGAALVQLYTEDAKLVLLDREGNRYLPTGDCRILRLLHEEDLLSRCHELSGENRILLLNLLEKVHNYRTVDADWVELSKRVARLEGLREKFRQEEIYSLIRYCYDNFQGELMDGYLAKLNLDYLTKEERNQMIELLIVRNRYDLALDAIAKYGLAGISPKRVLRLCEHMLLQFGEEQNDMLLVLCRGVFFEGRYNETIVQYLVRHFYGTTEEMYRVWQAAEELSLPATVLEERLLGQVLFAESYVPEIHKVFISYNKRKNNPKLVRAYVSSVAYRYFLRDCEVPEEVFSQILKEAAEDNTICCLAVLKSYVGLETLTNAQAQYAEYSMRRLAEQGKVFPFFAEFEGRVPLPPCMSDKIYVEYRTNPKRNVMISYLYDNEEAECFVSEEMEHIGYGIFVKEFILFYGEILQYYITEEQESGQVITESFYRKIDVERVHDETTKYGQINLILTAQDMKDDKTTVDMLENYFRMEYTMNRLFAPMKE